jgi:hypothetical protein
LHRITLPAGRETRTIVAAEDPLVVRRVVSGLEALSSPYQVLEPSAAVVSAAPGGAVYCLDARVASDLPDFRGPTVVILSGARLSDEAVLRLQGRRMCTLRLDALNPTSLLGAMVSARSVSEASSLVAQLARMERLRKVPLGLITAFLRAPAEMLRLNHLRRALAPMSREGAQRMVRSAGFPRAEHLFTALRCAAWVLLKHDGMNRREIERYLGIGDRTSFRRACRRAGVPPVHEHLSPETFDGVQEAPEPAGR